MKTPIFLTASAALLATVAAPALAQSAGEFTLGVGIGYVMPKSDNGDLTANNLEADVGGNTRPTLTVEYFVADNVGIELLAAWPFTHDVELGNLGEVAEVTHLPPTLSVNYHFNGQAGAGSISPFIGAGINYTALYDVDTKGALAGSTLDLDNSWGLAFNAGVDYRVTDNGSIRVNVRYIDIDADARLDGADIGTVEIDPWVFGASYVHKF
jgi:outer membrane protein